MNAKEAREIVELHKHLDRAIKDERLHSAMDLAIRPYLEAKGFLEGHEQATKAAEPLLEEIENLMEAIKVQIEASGSCQGGCCVRANKALSSSAQVLADYRKNVLGGRVK